MNIREGKLKRKRRKKTDKTEKVKDLIGDSQERNAFKFETR